MAPRRLLEEIEASEEELRRLYPPLPPSTYVLREVSVGCAVCQTRHRTHARMAVVRYGVPDFSLERSRRRYATANCDTEPRWWVSRAMKRSRRVIGGGTKWELLPTSKPGGSKVIDDMEIWTGGSIELECSYTRCSHRPGIKVAALIRLAKESPTDRIYI